MGRPQLRQEKKVMLRGGFQPPNIGLRNFRRLFEPALFDVRGMPRGRVLHLAQATISLQSGRFHYQ
jgi:hypothetical protein